MRGPLKQRMTTLRYVTEAIKSFDNDPPDSDWQKGYLQALKDARDKK
jgi:hypothetical protein